MEVLGSGSVPWNTITSIAEVTEVRGATVTSGPLRSDTVVVGVRDVASVGGVGDVTVVTGDRDATHVRELTGVSGVSGVGGVGGVTGMGLGRRPSKLFLHTSKQHDDSNTGGDSGDLGTGNDTADAAGSGHPGAAAAAAAGSDHLVAAAAGGGVNGSSGSSNLGLVGDLATGGGSYVVVRDDSMGSSHHPSVMSSPSPSISIKPHRNQPAQRTLGHSVR